MAKTTTIRVRPETSAGLKEIAEADGHTMQDTAGLALAALQRKRRIDRARRQLAELRRDPEAWAAYVAELDSLPVGDGLV